MRVRSLAAVLTILVALSLVPTAAFARPTMAIARGAGVTMRAPSRHVLGVGFHQANSRSAVSLDPLRGLTMASRRRGTSRTSAIDVAVRREKAVLAPVTGRVRSVSRYRLYGDTRDVIIEITPKANPRVRAVVLHVKSPRVRPGRWVRAGVTRIAGRARLLPFRSQIDAYTGRRSPHVHLELRRR